MQNREFDSEQKTKAENSEERPQNDREIRRKKMKGENIGQVDERRTEISESEKTKLNDFKGKIYRDFKKLFTENHEIKNFENEVEFKQDMEFFQQKGRRIPIHLQEAVEKELDRLQKEGHLHYDAKPATK